MKGRLMGLLALVLLASCVLSPVVKQDQHVVQWDLADILKKDTLKLLVDFSKETYMEDLDLGFDFTLISELAKDLKVHVKLIHVANTDSLWSALNQGLGDVAACNLTYHALRDSLVDFCEPLYATRQVLVQQSYTRERPVEKRKLVLDTTAMDTLPIVVTPGAFFTLSPSAKKNTHYQLAPSSYAPMDLVRLVSEGRIAATVVEENMASMWAEEWENLNYQVKLTKPLEVAWAVRSTSVKLKERINDWLNQESVQELVNSLRAGYFNKGTTYQVSRHLDLKMPALPDGYISPFDSIFKLNAKTIGWDWRLLTALAYQESRFNPFVTSHHGAFGVMQMMPKTAMKYGCDTTDLAFGNIRASVQYLAEMDRALSKKVKNKEERVKFVLASYNAGLGHVLDAMVIARHMGLQDTVWYDHVEEALMLKSQKEYYTLEGVNSGYCRCQETYHFVYRILAFYEYYCKKRK